MISQITRCHFSYFPTSIPPADKPRVKIVREADEILEEGRSTVSLTCEADGNPAPRVFWRKYGGNPRNPGQDPSDVKEYKTKQEFDPVTRQNSGTYVCQAENSVGLSDEVTSDVDVLCKYNSEVFCENLR